MERYMASLLVVRETNVVKLVHNWQNDGHQKHLHSEGEETPECPVCGKYEHHYHFFYCKNSQMTQQYNKCRDTFIKAHKKMHTASSIFHIFKQVLLHLRQGKEPPFPDLPNDKIGVIVKKAWNQQQNIGWHNLPKWQLSIEWGKAQQVFYSSNPKTATKKKLQ